MNPCAPLQNDLLWKSEKHSPLHCIYGFAYGFPSQSSHQCLYLEEQKWEKETSSAAKYLGTVIWIHDIMLGAKKESEKSGVGEMCVCVFICSRWQFFVVPLCLMSNHWRIQRGPIRPGLPSWFLPRCMKCRRGIAMRILSVCLSVCLSVRHTRDPWQNGRKIGPDFYTLRKNIYPSFLRRRMVGGGDPFYVKFWVNRPPLERNRRFSTNNRS